MNIRQVIQEIGLNDKEVDVYLELLKSHGEQPASLISQKVGLNRTTVYKILLKLAKAGLVTKTMKYGITCFLAEDPELSLEKMLLKKQRRLDELNQQFTHILPEIQNMQKQDITMPNMRYYEGVEGVKRVYEDTLVEEEIIYAFEDVGSMDSRISDYILNDYVPRRIEKNIFAHVITPENKHNLDFRKTDKESLRDTRIMKEPLFNVDLEINIYGQKTAFFSYKTEEMFAVILKSQAISNSMKAIFDVCWKIAK